eukprot:SAG31_NODE_20807_length_565_cov_0.656652_1_plen_144_part_00
MEGTTAALRVRSGQANMAPRPSAAARGRAADHVCWANVSCGNLVVTQLLLVLFAGAHSDGEKVCATGETERLNECSATASKMYNQRLYLQQSTPYISSLPSLYSKPWTEPSPLHLLKFAVGRQLNMQRIRTLTLLVHLTISDH